MALTCPSLPPVFQVAEASTRTLPVNRSSGWVFWAIVATICRSGASYSRSWTNESTMYSVWPLVEAKTIQNAGEALAGDPRQPTLGVLPCSFKSLRAGIRTSMSSAAPGVVVERSSSARPGCALD
jgi:hypothetical protein